MKLNNSPTIKILSLIILLSSCKPEKKQVLVDKKIPVIIVEYSGNRFHHSDTTFLTIRKKDSINVHLFGLEKVDEYERTIDIPFGIDPKDDSKILLGTLPINLVGKKQYYFNDKILNVKKYYYDLEDEIDEEGHFFVMNNKVVAFSSTAWNLNRFYIYENSEISELLRKDKSNFFSRRQNLEIPE